MEKYSINLNKVTGKKSQGLQKCLSFIDTEKPCMYLHISCYISLTFLILDSEFIIVLQNSIKWMKILELISFYRPSDKLILCDHLGFLYYK